MKLINHAAYLLSAMLGDDYVSKRIRHALLRAMGARIGYRDTHLHGGTYLSRPGNFTVGDHCFINRGCYLDLEGRIVVGDHVTIGHGATMITTAHAVGSAGHRSGAMSTASIALEDGCWVGANATILPGVTVGRGAVVAAGAVVTTTVPPNTIVGGVPARSIRVLEEIPDSPTVGLIDLQEHRAGRTPEGRQASPPDRPT